MPTPSEVLITLQQPQYASILSDSSLQSLFARFPPPPPVDMSPRPYDGAQMYFLVSNTLALSGMIGLIWWKILKGRAKKELERKIKELEDASAANANANSNSSTDESPADSQESSTDSTASGDRSSWRASIDLGPAMNTLKVAPKATLRQMQKIGPRIQEMTARSKETMAPLQKIAAAPFKKQTYTLTQKKDGDRRRSSIPMFTNPFGNAGALRHGFNRAHATIREADEEEVSTDDDGSATTTDSEERKSSTDSSSSDSSFTSVASCPPASASLQVPALLQAFFDHKDEASVPIPDTPFEPMPPLISADSRDEQPVHESPNDTSSRKPADARVKQGAETTRPGVVFEQRYEFPLKSMLKKTKATRRAPCTPPKGSANQSGDSTSSSRRRSSIVSSISSIFNKSGSNPKPSEANSSASPSSSARSSMSSSDDSANSSQFRSSSDASASPIDSDSEAGVPTSSSQPAAGKTPGELVYARMVSLAGRDFPASVSLSNVFPSSLSKEQSPEQVDRATFPAGV